MSIHSLIAELDMARQELERIDPAAADRVRAYGALVRGPHITLHWTDVWPVQANSSLQLTWEAPMRCLITLARLRAPDGLDAELALGNLVAVAGPAEALEHRPLMLPVPKRGVVNLVLRNSGGSALNPLKAEYAGYPLADDP